MQRNTNSSYKSFLGNWGLERIRKEKGPSAEDGTTKFGKV